MAGQQPSSYPPPYRDPYERATFEPAAADAGVAEEWADQDEWADWQEPERVVVVRRRRGLHIGPVSVTPTRVAMLIALVGSTAFLAYAITVRDLSQVPMLASGAAVLGIVFGALALSGVMGSVTAARSGAGGRSFAMAMGGGIAALIAAGCLAAAIVLALVIRS